MTDGLFGAVELGVGGGRAGYRLSHVEVFNWGTFDQRVWRLTADGDTTLLTGDIGSGKSTLVDAVTTLLLPANRISYNKAAGADAKERTLRSYVEGHYRSESIESTGTSRPVGLRDQRSYSVILGVFRNEGFDETVTLAQVFHAKEQSGQPDRFYVLSDKQLSVEADFTDFGADLTDLRRRLRDGGATVLNHGEFPKYATGYRRMLGIRSEQAMELFHQTVSMKSVGNLNEFVRTHMLEPVDAADRVRGIVGHFEDLTRAHESVTRAREQLEALKPVVAAADRYDAALAERAEAVRQRDAVRLFIIELRLRLLADEIAALQSDVDAHERDLAQLEAERTRLRDERESLVEERARAGGDRVGELERTAETARTEAAGRLQKRRTFDQRVDDAGLAPITDAAAFADVSTRIAEVRGELGGRRSDVDEQRSSALGELAEVKRAGDRIRAELASLAGRANNLPSDQVDLRAQLCNDLRLREEDLPFAGELLDVADEHAGWRGAAERVLRRFALSLLVPQEHYAAVSTWVNSRRLTHQRSDGRIRGSRLVYERVSARRVPLRRAESTALLLADTIEVKDGPFADYLRDELVRRADHVCAETVEAFRAESRAVTREGQVRSRERHEKDDRFAVDDASRWVLGWANERKRAALTEQAIEQQARLLDTQGRCDELKRELDAIENRLRLFAALETYTAWSELDHEEATGRAKAAEAERDRLVAGSSALAEIERRLDANGEEQRSVETAITGLRETLGGRKQQVDVARRDQHSDEQVVAALEAPVLAAARAVYPELERLLGTDLPSRSRDCAAAQDQLGSAAAQRIEKVDAQLARSGQTMVQHMGSVRARWPEVTTEMDASVESRAEFRAFHERVAGDDLPRFEADFKRLLNTETIRELAAFHSWLRRQADDIGARVSRINEALGAIDYSPGHYITLVTEATVNQEVRDFRADLRTATTDVLSPDDDHYTEQRFADVQRIIERFRGRDGHAEADRAWTRRVTDVRNWFTFAASERDRVTDTEREHYRDSDGKSGGQKEKLAYTILAASLAYQFGLEWGVEKSRDFRFAVIDEAFGRGSDASTRYALELFAKLGLQLLIVTPLQKVHIIEPYVHAIGFVDNPTGIYSRVRTLTIEEFREQREQQA